MKQTLFEIGAELQTLRDVIDAMDGDITDPEIERQFDDYLLSMNEAEGNQAEKLQNYVNLINHYKTKMAEQQVWVDEAARVKKQYEAIRDRHEREAEKHQKRLADYMEFHGHEELATSTGLTLKLKDNPAKVVEDYDFDIGRIPMDLVRQKLELDKDAIKEAIKIGRIVPGVSVVQTKKLRIK